MYSELTAKHSKTNVFLQVTKGSDNHIDGQFSQDIWDRGAEDYTNDLDSVFSFSPGAGFRHLHQSVRIIHMNDYHIAYVNY